jgi:hypothetical protein
MHQRVILRQLEISGFQVNAQNIWSAWEWYFKLFITKGLIVRVEIQLQIPFKMPNGLQQSFWGEHFLTMRTKAFMQKILEVFG